MAYVRVGIICMLRGARGPSLALGARSLLSGFKCQSPLEQSRSLQGSCAGRRARGSTVLRACCAGFWATGRVAVGCVCVLGALVLAAPLAHGRKGGGGAPLSPPFPRFSGFFVSSFSNVEDLLPYL